MRNIVLEGPDNAGKTTLADLLSKALHFPIRHSGGPSKYPGEVNKRAETYINDPKLYIYDRHPCVSQNIYVEALAKGGELIEYVHQEAFYKSHPILIYCRSDGSLDGHRQSDHSSLEYFQQVANNYKRLCNLYDVWGLKKANIIYRIGDDVPTLVNMIRGLTHG